MNDNFQLVADFHRLSQKNYAADAETSMSDMTIIEQEAILMEETGALFHALKLGDLSCILAGLVNLSYASLYSLVLTGQPVAEKKHHHPYDGQVLSIAKNISQHVNDCLSGQAEDYYKLYCLCKELAKDFLNADFDSAFKLVHDNRMSFYKDNPTYPHYHVNSPDLSDCLFE